MQFFKRKKKTIGLALSGGGLRGIAHLGVIKALEEYDLKPSVISGTSAGAIVGAFYSAGFSPDELIAMVQKISFFSARSLRFSRSALFDKGMLMKIFMHYMPENNFSSLKIPLYITATDIVSGRPKYFHQGELHNALMASASIPFIFPVAKMEEHYFLDGGIINNLPIEPIQQKCDVLIGVHVNALSTKDGATISGRALFDRVIHLALGQSVYHKSGLCDLFIEPPDMTRFNMFDKKNATTMFNYAYGYTFKYLAQHQEKIKKLLR